MNLSNKIRISKFISNAGYCSRRQAETLVESGVIEVDSNIIRDLSFKVDPLNSSVKVKGKMISLITNPRLWILHKKSGYITSYKDNLSRKTVFDALPQDMPRVISIGRLDYNTEGLLLLTNFPSLARNMELPSSGLERKYLCRVFGVLKDDVIEEMKNGVSINGFRYKSIIVKKREYSKKNISSINNYWLEISLNEGKNREIRRVLEYFGIQVSRLIRISFGDFVLPRNLEPGCVREIQSKYFQKYLLL
ncbi:MAG: pseudouridine synthase [Proteobacteria bacterium]|nr:pseudouridine synthase [Pseudomonadota bacterium]